MAGARGEGAALGAGSLFVERGAALRADASGAEGKRRNSFGSFRLVEKVVPLLVVVAGGGGEGKLSASNDKGWRAVLVTLDARRGSSFDNFIRHRRYRQNQRPPAAAAARSSRSGARMAASSTPSDGVDVSWDTDTVRTVGAAVTVMDGTAVRRTAVVAFSSTKVASKVLMTDAASAVLLVVMVAVMRTDAEDMAMLTTEAGTPSLSAITAPMACLSASV